jgi:hypothetical protein
MLKELELGRSKAVATIRHAAPQFTSLPFFSARSRRYAAVARGPDIEVIAEVAMAIAMAVGSAPLSIIRLRHGRGQRNLHLGLPKLSMTGHDGYVRYGRILRTDARAHAPG